MNTANFIVAFITFLAGKSFAQEAVIFFIVEGETIASHIELCLCMYKRYVSHTVYSLPPPPFLIILAMISEKSFHGTCTFQEENTNNSLDSVDFKLETSQVNCSGQNDTILVSV